MTDFGKDQKKQVEINLGKGLTYSVRLPILVNARLRGTQVIQSAQNLDNTIV